MMSLSKKTMWIPLGIVAALSSAISMIFDKLTASQISGAGVGIFNVALTIVMLLGMMLFSSESVKFSIERKVWPYLAASALCNAVGTVLYYVIMDYASVSDAAAIDQFTLIFVFVGAVIILGESVTWKSITGSILLIIGMFLMMY